MFLRFPRILVVVAARLNKINDDDYDKKTNPLGDDRRT